ncbi:hypothetical protein FRC17_004227 [Serendipita sp. 399]|nr:hypothetical protein FRC17_004227 [Serendipita sp. 399]
MSRPAKAMDGRESESLDFGLFFQSPDLLTSVGLLSSMKSGETKEQIKSSRMLKRPLGIFSSQRAKGKLLSDDFVDIHIEQLADHDSESPDDDADTASLPKKRRIHHAPEQQALAVDVDVEDHQDEEEVGQATPLQAIGISNHQQQQSQRLESTKSSGLEDLEDIKDVFASAVDKYEANELEEAVELFRTVVHESNLLLKHHPDLATLFWPNGSPDSARARSPLSNRSDPIRTTDGPSIVQYLYGTSLLLLGRILEVYPVLAKDGEPVNTPAFYLAALDVFEDGENAFRSVTDGVFLKGDWRLAYSTGRTLVAVTEEKIRRLTRPTHTTATLVDFQDDLWPKDSGFARSFSKRPPLIRRVTLPSSTPNEMLTSACDHFSRAMLHMPRCKRQYKRHSGEHQHYHPHHYQYSLDVTDPNPASSLPSSPSPRRLPHPIDAPPTLPGLGIKTRTLVHTVRPRILYTMANEVLSVADRMPAASERQEWAKWADDVFLQMEMEEKMAAIPLPGTTTTATAIATANISSLSISSDEEDWSLPISIGRGRCWLIIGASRFEAIESQLEEEDDDDDEGGGGGDKKEEERQRF